MSSNERRVKKEFFYPNHIAIFGPSEKRGYYWIHSLIDTGFNGAIYPIHKTKKFGGGLKFYQYLSDVPEQVDYAIIAVPAEHVSNVLKECAKNRVKFVHIFTSGFSESGEIGRKRSNEIKEIIKKNKMCVAGPNCLGIYCPKSGLSFRSEIYQMDEGGVSFISQSGGIATNVVMRGHKQNLLFSKVISIGNSVDLQSADFLEFLAEDPETKVIGLYLENMGRNEEEKKKLISALKFANKKKPVVVWRGGRTALGARAALSHTGATPTDLKTWDEIVKQTGIVEVRTFEELIDTLIAFEIIKPEFLPKGLNVGLIAVSGGLGVTNSDILGDIGLKIPYLSEKTMKEIMDYDQVSSVGVSAANPIDLGGGFLNLSVMKKVITLSMQDENINSMIIEISQHYIYDRILLLDINFSQAFLKRILETIIQASQVVKGKPVALVMPTVAYEMRDIFDRDYFVRKGIPVFDTVENAGKVIRNLYKYQTHISSKNNL